MYNSTELKAETVKSYTRVCQVVEHLTPYYNHRLGYFFNIKTLFTLILGIRHDVSMAQAIEHMQLPLDGRHHRGDDDAWNVSQLLYLLLIARKEIIKE